ncbi:MAG: cyclic nucleotide-binding domain-containing protein [Alphaproteobacteria bacterium]
MAQQRIDTSARLPAAGRALPCAACDVRELAVCGALRPEELHRLAPILVTIRCEPKATVFYEGDAADYLFNVNKGAVRVSKLLADGRRQVTGFLFPGDFLGLAFNDTYSYTAEAITKTQLCRFKRAELERLLQSMPHMEKRLLEMASNELATAQDQMMLLGRKTARERLASFLVMLRRRAERRGQASDPLDLPMSRGDIADYLGLTIETVSRTFTELRKLGYIDLPEANRVKFLRPTALEDAAAQ